MKKVAIFFFLSFFISLFPYTVKYKPAKRKNLSYFPLYISVFLPGYGMLQYQKPLWASLYFTLRIGAYFLIYLSYEEYRFWNSVYIAARPYEKEPGEIFFQDPRNKENYISLQEIKNRRGRALLFFGYSILVTSLVMGMELFHIASFIQEEERKSKPSFLFSIEEDTLKLGYRRVF